LKWVGYALFAGATTGLGNYILGVNLANTGFFAPGFTGPLGFLALVTYRLVSALRTKCKYGSFVNYNNSNWFKGPNK